jgi:glycosyltransferase involved in cell wall biosynthesis
MDTFDKPKGGTELMYDELMKRLPMNYQEEFSIFNYLPHADFSKPTIYWNQLSYDQGAVQFLKEPEWIDKIDRFVFVSHWQAEKFRQLFNIPGYKTHVFKNASIGVNPRQHGERKKVKLCYTSTPWRGLEVLLKAWEILKPENAELHVFSSCKIYGKEFGESDSQYEHLYNKCKELPGIVYRGSVSNEKLRQELPEFDILAYPNTFEETSCIAVIEALSAGLRVVTSALGALPETTEGWARMYSYLPNPELHAETFAKILGEEIEIIRENKLQDHLTDQVNIYNKRWSWDYRITEWTKYLDELYQTYKLQQS